MFWKYLRIALRNFRKHKLPAAINVAGLALGFACCVLLLLFVDHELRYDRFHEDADRIYRVTYHATEPDGGTVHRAQTPPLLTEDLQETYSAIESAARVGRRQLKTSSESLVDENQNVTFTDPALFDVFSFSLDRGSVENALDDPADIIVSKEAARRYFPGMDPIGKTLTIQMETGPAEFTVSAVAKSVPDASSVRFDLLVPFHQYRNTYGSFLRSAVFDSWSMPLPVVESYVKLHAGASETDLVAAFPSFVVSHWTRQEAEPRIDLQPLTAIHLDPGITNGLEPVGNPRNAWLMGGIALLILGIASMNFVTLMLARSVERAREVGVRKAVGADAGQIRSQFWGEALVTTVFALIAGLALAELILPTFNTLAGKALVLDLAARPWIWLAALGLVSIVALIAGAYPAVILSRFQPSQVLGGRGRVRGQRRLTQVLVTVQFGFSIALIAGLMIMDRQLEYVSEADMGFDSERIVVFNTSGTDNPESLFESMKQVAERRPEVQGLTGAFFSFGSQGLDLELQENEGPILTAMLNPVADNYVETMGLRLVKGTGLAAVSGERSVVVNEAFVNALGWENPIGRTLPVYDKATFKNVVEGMTIAGVVEDFNILSFHSEIGPVVLAPAAAMGGGFMTVSARLAAESDPGVLSAFESAWRASAPEKPFRYQYLQDVVADQYRSETRWRKIVAWAGGLALLIACFGLIGLALFSTRQRTREIGIRKVLGASASGIVFLLSKEYARLVVFGAILAVPVAWAASEQWLDGFAYRARIGPLVYVLAGLGALFIALLVTGVQAARAASADPVRSLRTE